MLSSYGTLVDMKINGRDVERGTELSIRNKRGRYSYHSVRQTTSGRTVVTVIGPINSGREAFHCCYLEDVQTVHRVERRVSR